MVAFILCGGHGNTFSVSGSVCFFLGFRLSHLRLWLAFLIPDSWPASGSLLFACPGFCVVLAMVAVCLGVLGFPALIFSALFCLMHLFFASLHGQTCASPADSLLAGASFFFNRQPGVLFLGSRISKRYYICLILVAQQGTSRFSR